MHVTTSKTMGALQKTMWEMLQVFSLHWYTRHWSKLADAAWVAPHPTFYSYVHLVLLSSNSASSLDENQMEISRWALSGPSLPCTIFLPTLICARRDTYTMSSLEKPQSYAHTCACWYAHQHVAFTCITMRQQAHDSPMAYIHHAPQNHHGWFQVQRPMGWWHQSGCAHTK